MSDDMFNTNVKNSLLNNYESTNNLSFFDQQQKSKNNTTKLNKTYINIDSRNRNITNKLDFKQIISQSIIPGCSVLKNLIITS